MQKFLFTALIISTMAMAACSKETTPVEKSQETAAAPQASEECVVSPPAEAMACTMDWNPVCGCDGVTYGNACGAKAAGVNQFTEGACEEERAD